MVELHRTMQTRQEQAVASVKRPNYRQHSYSGGLATFALAFWQFVHAFEVTE